MTAGGAEDGPDPVVGVGHPISEDTAVWVVQPS